MDMWHAILVCSTVAVAWVALWFWRSCSELRTRLNGAGVDLQVALRDKNYWYSRAEYWRRVCQEYADGTRRPQLVMTPDELKQEQQG